MKYWSTITALVVSIPLSFFSHAMPPDPNILQKSAPYSYRQRGSEESYLAIVRGIAQVFGAPISLEWPYVEEDKSPIEYPKIPFAFEKGETLAAVLDRLCKATDGQLQWRNNLGIIYLGPAPSKLPTDGMLDTPVTLKLENVSAWHACLELVRAVNAEAPAGRVLFLTAMPTDDGGSPPQALRDDTRISLDFAGATARDVLCAIMAASPFYMEFRYHSSYRPDLPSPPSGRISLWCYDQQRNLLRGPQRSAAESDVWYEEAMSVIPQQAK